MPEYKAADELFYSFHSEFEAIVMDMLPCEAKAAEQDG